MKVVEPDLSLLRARGGELVLLLVCSEEVIFSVSEGRLRPGGEKEVVQADTVMYSNNILVGAKQEMLKCSRVSVLSLLFLVFCFNVAQATALLAIWRTSSNCLSPPVPGFCPCAAGVAKEFEQPYALRMQRGQR